MSARRLSANYHVIRLAEVNLGVLEELRPATFWAGSAKKTCRNRKAQ
jgi:hypothetical protein